MTTRWRHLLLWLCLPLGPGFAGAAGTVAIDHILSGWRDSTSFKRISEYFTGRENTGGQVILRTDPARRAGYYFLVRTRQSAAVDAEVRLTIFIPGRAEPRVLAFPVQLPARTAVINLGLTGADWPDPKASPVAWHLEILDPAGKVLDAEKSYLWDTPNNP